MKRTVSIRWILLFVLSLSQSGCPCMIADQLEDAAKVYQRESSISSAKGSAPAQLAILNVMASKYGKCRYDKGARRLCSLKAQSYAAYAFGIQEIEYIRCLAEPNGSNGPDKGCEAIKSDISNHYVESYEAARKRLSYELPRVNRLLDGRNVEALRKELNVSKKGFSDDEIASLFDVAMALALNVNLNRDDLSLVLETPKAVAMLNAVEDRTKDWTGGKKKNVRSQALMMLGVYHASVPTALRRDPMLAEKYFDEVDKNSLTNKVLRAVFLSCEARDDWDKTQGELKQVAMVDDKVITKRCQEAGEGECRQLEDLLARERAQIYLAHANKLLPCSRPSSSSKAE